ncbi:hypothetical protein ACHHYP_05982 [Achlya hypogyna]|uniref:Rab-GAP TBC domain-containing protein n=1 Tax=Achlya hypogyna TaxID=1202772 RepID=A0A1V9YVT9_ACHHY|nr:hypothetical protein ACHHYP_05982 [Achlya hypogyna]
MEQNAVTHDEPTDMQSSSAVACMHRAVASALDEVVLDSSWQEEQNMIYDMAAAFVAEHDANPSARQVLLSLCGQGFQAARYPSTRNQGYLLREPYMASETRAALERQLYPLLLASLASRVATQSIAMQQLRERLQAAFDTNYTLSSHLPATAIVLSFFSRAFTAPALVDPALDAAQHAQEDQVVAQLRGRSLPMPLRHWLWWRQVHCPSKLAEVQWRLKASQTLLGLPEPWASPIGAMLFRLVRDALREDYAQYAASADVRDRVTWLLNQYYVLTTTHSAYFVAIALPVVLLFPAQSAKGPELLAVFTTLVDSHLHHPMRGDAIAGSQRLWRLLAQRLPRVYLHMESIFGNIPAAKKRLAMFEAPSELFVSWLQVSFVGYLRTEALFFVWDQCLLSGCAWKEAMEAMCLTVLGLLAPEIVQVDDIPALHTVLETRPQQLRTHDLRAAWQR